MILTDLGARWDLALAAFTAAVVLVVLALALAARLYERQPPSADEQADDERSLDSVRARLRADEPPPADTVQQQRRRVPAGGPPPSEYPINVDTWSQM